MRWRRRLERPQEAVNERNAWLAAWFHPHNEYDLGARANRAPSSDRAAAGMLLVLAGVVVAALVLELPTAVLALALAGLLVGLVALAIRAL